MTLAAPLRGIIDLLGARLGQLDPVLLAPLQGKLILLEVAGLGPVYLWGCNGGLSAASDPDAKTPDLQVRGDLLGLLQLARTGRADASVTVIGDTELAQALQALLSSAPLLAEELAAQLVGGSVAGAVAGLARQLSQDAQQAAQALRVSLRDYLQTEAQLVPTAAEVAAFNQAVDVLRDDVARLALRLQRLQAQRAALAVRE